ncbi:MAG: nitrate reductase cytochrome c-type subunit [Sphingomonadales bacterium]
MYMPKKSKGLRKTWAIPLGAVAVLGSILAAIMLVRTPAAQVEQEPVTSLRGGIAIDENNAGPEIFQPDIGKRFIRNYRQQPPLIPHRIDKYEIDRKINQCLRCHDWPRNVEENAPKVSETHYVARDGSPLDNVAATRWFCTQCHATQADAKPLVKNNFKPAVSNR